MARVDGGSQSCTFSVGRCSTHSDHPWWWRCVARLGCLHVGYVAGTPAVPCHLSLVSGAWMQLGFPIKSLCLCILSRLSLNWLTKRRVAWQPVGFGVQTSHSIIDSCFLFPSVIRRPSPLSSIPAPISPIPEVRVIANDQAYISPVG